MSTRTFSILALLAFPAIACAQDLTLVRDGRSTFSMVIAANASPSVRRGASEIQVHVERMSGARLPVVTDDQPLPKDAILVGRSRHTDALRPQDDLKALGPEGFILRTVNGHVLVLGSDVRGAMYGCTSLLETLGVRWFTPTVTRVPRRPTVTLADLNDRELPDFEYREVFIAEAMDKDWAARLRTNGANTRLDDSTGGKVVYDHFVHTFDALIPQSEFAAHPEYFPLIKGKRTGGYVQRCLSNPDVLRLMTAGVKKWIEQSPGAMIFSVSQNDTAKFCECDNCKAIESRYGNAHSGLYLWFVNQIAESVEKDHPDKLIDTLAYQFTEQPPVGIVPRKNVRVRLCPIAACEAHPYESCADPKTVAFVANLKAWSRITDTLYIWHYNTDFGHYLMPFPDFAQFPDSTRLYKRSGVKGIFFEGDSTPGSADADLKSYVMAHLLWHSDQDADALVNEWMHGVYGAAYPPMRKWFDLLHEKVKPNDKHLHIFDRPNNYFLTDETLAAGDKLFDEAGELARGDEAAAYYVAKARLGLQYVELVRKPDLKAFERFTAELPRFGINHLSEHQALPAWEKALRERLDGATTRPANAK